MADLISVIIPTYNPDPARLQLILEALANQTLAPGFWELILVDNNSSNNFSRDMELSRYNNLKIVQEKKQGLTYARVKGFLEARGDLIILVDDDNVLDRNYLQEALKIYHNYPAIGVYGGKSIPIFETTQPNWLNDFYKSLALRDHGGAVLIDDWQNKFPEHAPIGAGMVIRKSALGSYVSKITSGTTITTDRIGDLLSSGGDNDIVLEILKSGWRCGYFPELILHHLIPEERLSVSYLAKLLNHSSKSWIQLLDSHDINPWAKIPAWTVPLRKLKAWFIFGAWKNAPNYIKWRGICGKYDGLGT
jgi:glycosyltransferase involved in cell wall biosynthesis